MDKSEYQIKLDQITQLVAKQDYEGALEIVDTIDWRRVKSVRTLCMVADIYEVNERLDDSKRILLLAYKRSSIGKVILYRLVESCLKLGEVDEAVEYYTEYVQLFPGDSSKYILKYKIYKAKRASIEDQIAILEEYKEKEYTERWAYELARLYRKAGLEEQCIEACDDLILWFSEGEYVTRAMELKMRYTPLTPSQQEKYDSRSIQPEPEQEIVPLNEAVQEDSVRDTEAEQAADTTTADLRHHQPERIETEKLQEKLTSSLRDVLSGIHKKTDELFSGFVEEAEEPDSDDVDLRYDTVKELEPENLEGNSVLSAEVFEQEAVWEAAATSEERGLQQTAADSGESDEPEVDEVQKLLEETAAQMAQQIAGEEFRKGAVIEEESKAEEIPEEEPKTEEIPEEEPKTEEAEPETETTEEIKADGDLAGAIGDTQTFCLDGVGDLAKSAAFEEAAEEISIEERILAGETPQERRTRILRDTRPENFSDEQKKLFTYFSGVPGMDQQILDALHGVYKHAADKTSKRGNIAVMGRQGSGKTKLTDSLVLGICQDLKLEAVKMARISGAEMNRKDPAQVVGKLSGGFLLIEQAGQMTTDTVDGLSKALSFRTDSMVLIIEDEKNSMRRLLKENEEFADMFGTVISIPVFTNDELITFARTYARELGYRIDELGILALYTRIGEKQTEDEPMTVATVKDMIDNAMLKAHRGKLNRKVSGRRLDAEGRIILFEKDFDL